MHEPKSLTVNLVGDYPTFKKVDGKLVPLDSRDPSKRYSLTSDVQTGETYYLQYSDEEEAQADRQKAEWEASAPTREAEAKRLAEEAEKFESALKYQKRIVAFIDILGWKNTVLTQDKNSGAAVKALGKTLAQLKWVANHTNSLNGLLPDKQKWPGNPLMTHFSDSLVISTNDDVHGKDALQNALFVLTSNLIQFGFLLRGGVVRGELFHDGGLVFGPALIEAYQLENDVASAPRVILSKELSAEWGTRENSGSLPWIPSPDGYLFFNFLPPFMGNKFFTDPSLWQSRLEPIRNLIISMAQNTECLESVFAKYLWLAGYFDAVCDEKLDCGVNKVLQVAAQSRWRR